MATITRSRQQQPSRHSAMAPKPEPSNSLLSSLNQSERESILASGTSQRYGRHQVVFCEGDPIDNLYQVQSGSVKLVQHSEEGKELIVALIGAGGSFGAAVLPRDTGVMAQALEPSTIVAIPLARLRHVLTRHPETSLALIDHLERTQTKLQLIASQLAFESVPRRLAKLLIRESASDNGEMIFPLNQSELANSIGSSRETVCSILNQMQREGLLRIRNGRVVVRDRAGLAVVR